MHHSLGKDEGPIFSRLWTKVHKIFTHCKGSL